MNGHKAFTLEATASGSLIESILRDPRWRSSRTRKRCRKDVP
jgi:hypothetical protein